MSILETITVISSIIAMEDLIKIEIRCESHLDASIIQSLRAAHFVDREYQIDLILDNSTHEKKNLKPLLGTCLDLTDSNIIDLSTVSHVVMHISNEGGKYFGHVKIFDTHYGKLLKQLIYTGVDICLVPDKSSLYAGKLNIVNKDLL